MKNRDKLGRFVKGHPFGKRYKKGIHPKTEFKKGEHFSPTTEFKKGQFGKKAGHWKGGKCKDGDYIMIWVKFHPFCNKDGYVRKHRLIIEKFIKRYLQPQEKCHHLNGIKDDNQPKNLMAFTSESAHQRFHHNPANVKSKEIIFDGRQL